MENTYMFHTEELKQVIDQLQSSHGASLGYFDTLLLITKLIGLCAGPILFVFAVFAVLYFVPKYLPQILIPLEKDMKPYYFLCSWGYKNLNDLHFEGIRFTKKYKAILEKGRQNNRKRAEKMRELRMSDPEYRAKIKSIFIRKLRYYVNLHYSCLYLFILDCRK